MIPGSKLQKANFEVWTWRNHRLESPLVDFEFYAEAIPKIVYRIPWFKSEILHSFSCDLVEVNIHFCPVILIG